jgi:hypothetical protein
MLNQLPRESLATFTPSQVDESSIKALRRLY